MKRKIRSKYLLAFALLLLFAVFTVLVQKVDVQPIGPSGSEVGFASLNGSVHDKLGENDACYKLTKLIGYLALATAPCFALPRRRGLRSVGAGDLLCAGRRVLCGV